MSKITQATPCWAYDPVTGELLGERIASPDPIEGKPLVPAHATLIAPPKTIPEGSVAVFDETKNKWSVMEDHRGQVVWVNNQEVTIDKLGPLPKGASKTKPLSVVKQEKLSQLRIDYETALNAGVTYQGATFQSDPSSIQSLNEVLTALANGWVLPANFEWIDANNTPHPVPDVTWLQGLATVLADHKSALFARLQKAKAAVRAAKTVSAVNKVVL
ncbi:DUF4376 domain-containing protein [Candidatus Parcubacteria bacterium]|nr:MAG: DUF4376 domain-containing protein [Candidatus Parcubacteria bacterium]